MRERLCHYSITVADPDETGALSTLEAYVQFPFSFTIVGVSVAPGMMMQGQPLTLMTTELT
jgi:hypothetical protein